MEKDGGMWLSLARYDLGNSVLSFKVSAFLRCRQRQWLCEQDSSGSGNNSKTGQVRLRPVKMETTGERQPLGREETLLSGRGLRSKTQKEL